MTHEQIHSLVAARLQVVLAIDDAPAPHASFAEDLHADSLDLLEVVEGVEADLADRGMTVHVPEAAIAGLRTVDDAVRAIRQALGTQPPRPTVEGAAP